MDYEEVSRMNGNCGSGCGTGRSFLTKDEEIEMLKEYQEARENDTKGVRERIKELEKTA